MKRMLLIIGSVWPEPASSAAGRHMLELIRFFMEQHWHITFASPAADSQYRHALDRLGIDEQQIEVNSSSFDDWLADLQPQLVLFDRYIMEEQFGWRVAMTCPDALRILDTEDLHSLRHARQRALQQNRKVNADDLSSDIAKREIASILRCDLSLIISQYEIQLLQQHYRVDAQLLHYLPFLCAAVDEQKQAQWPGYEQRRDFLFVGTLLHAPNLDAVRYMKQDIWPLIRKQLPDVSLHIVGAYPTAEVLQFDNPVQGFRVHGRVADLQPMLSACRVCLAPLRFGAGIKGKLIEAMLAGMPSVTTSVGAEGIAGDMDWSGLVEQSSHEFAAAAVRLYQEEELWTEAQVQGGKIINSRFDSRQHTDNLQQCINWLQQNLAQQRQANFTGQMLNYHTARSTEFMARWIECKNRRQSSD